MTALKEPTDQELQETGRLGSLGEQVSQTGASIDVGTEQPVQGAGLKPQHPAPGVPISPSQVVEQILRGVELNVKGENGEIRLQLKPDSLGEVEVRIATNNGIVSAEFIAESQRSKEPHRGWFAPAEAAAHGPGPEYPRTLGASRRGAIPTVETLIQGVRRPMFLVLGGRAAAGWFKGSWSTQTRQYRWGAPSITGYDFLQQQDGR